MTDPRRIGVSIDVKPHAYDPAVNPELFEGVLARRFVAFLIDVTILRDPGHVRGDLHLHLRRDHARDRLGALLAALARGGDLGDLLLRLHRSAARPRRRSGCGIMDLEMRTWYGAPAYFVLGAVHAIVYWVTVSFLTPFILLVAFFNRRRRCCTTMLVGTIVINNPARAQALRAPPG
jgi:hypothetical protein